MTNSVGRRYERLARIHYFIRGYRLLEKNLRLAGGEIDLLLRGRGGEILIVEVRGRIRRDYRPRHTIAPAKVARLMRLARVLERTYGAVVRVELCEIVGLAMTRLTIA